MSTPVAAPPNELFIVFATIGFIVSFIPFYWHLRAANTGTCLFMAWAGLGCLNGMVNAIMWNHNAINSAPIWCDISSRFIVGLNVGVPASMLIILMRLYKIASLKDVMIPPGERRRAVIVDLAIGVGIPVLQMILEIVVNTNRFNVWEDYGCQPSAWPSWLSWLIFYPWPFVISFVATGFGMMAYWHIRRRALQFQEFKSTNNLANRSRYQRLLGMTAIILTFSIIINGVVLRINASIPLNSQVSWDFIHADYFVVNSVPRVLITKTAVFALESQRWSSVVSSFIFFAFFGFADEARSHYRKAYTTLTGVMGHGSFISATSTHRGPIGMSSLTPSFAGRRQSFPHTLSVGYSPTVPSICTFTTSSNSLDFDRPKRDTMDSFIETLSAVPSNESSSLPLRARRSKEYPPGLGPAELDAGVASTPRTAHGKSGPALDTALPLRHEPDAPQSARPYSTWSDAV